jgi:hypothetical protein
MHAQDAIYLIIRGSRVFIQQDFGAHDNAWRAKAALQSAGCDKCIRENLPILLGETFERGHVLAGDAGRGHSTGYDGSIVDDHGTAPALTLRAASIFGRDQPATLAKKLQERVSLFNFNRSALPVKSKV